MFQAFLEKLCSELEIHPVPKINEQHVFPFVFAPGVEVNLSDLRPGVALHAIIGPCPDARKEELFIYLMSANLLGQGTGGARVGLSQDEKVLTLAIGLPYEMNYTVFKETLEEFVNHLIYWRDHVAKFEQEEVI